MQPQGQQAPNRSHRDRPLQDLEVATSLSGTALAHKTPMHPDRHLGWLGIFRWLGFPRRRHSKSDGHLSALRTRFGALRTRLGALRARLGALRRRLSALCRRLGALRRRLGALRTCLGASQRPLAPAAQNPFLLLACMHACMTLLWYVGIACGGGILTSLTAECFPPFRASSSRTRFRMQSQPTPITGFPFVSTQPQGFPKSRYPLLPNPGPDQNWPRGS